MPSRDADGNKIVCDGNGEYIDGVIYEEHPTKMFDLKTFQGQIEFKDVWFRYPTRAQQWVFKGLNLKIN